MQTRIKNESEINAMREGGKILGKLLHTLHQFIKPGTTGEQIDMFAQTFIEDHGMIPGFKGYHGFPATVCLCINDEVVHGIPSNKQVIRDGDIVTVDCGVIHKGLYTDSAVTYMIGDVDEKTKTFVKTVQRGLYAGLKQIKPGARLGDIGHAIEKVIRKGGYKIIKELVGHGIGENLHEDPHVPNFGKRGKGLSLKPGMTFAIEPIVGISTDKIITLEDNWMIATPDGTLACQWEHTILVTETGVEIITLREDDTIKL